MKATNIKTTYASITRTFDVVIDDNRTANVSKWILEDESGSYDNDDDIRNKDALNLTDEEYDELVDVISAVKMF